MRAWPSNSQDTIAAAELHKIPVENLSPAEAMRRFPQFHFDDDMVVLYQADYGSHAIAYASTDTERENLAIGASSYASNGKLSRVEYIGNITAHADFDFVYGVDLEEEGAPMGHREAKPPLAALMAGESAPVARGFAPPLPRRPRG